MESIVGIKERDRHRFDALFKLHHGKLYTYIKTKTQSDYLADEIVQLTFIKLWHNWNKLSEGISIEKQLFLMARQVMIDELRKEATRYKHQGEAADTPISDNLVRMIESKDLLKHFDKAIEQLPPMRKLVFNLSRQNGLSYKEIADMLSISTRTVESHINKTLLHLKQYLLTIML